MSISADPTAASAALRQLRHHEARAKDPQAAAAPALPAAPSVDGAPGIQQFSNELQSILLSAQNGATGTGNAGDAAVRSAGERLHTLLGAGSDTSSGATAATLPDILDRLHGTLNEALQSYGKAAAAAPPAGTLA